MFDTGQYFLNTSLFKEDFLKIGVSYIAKDIRENNRCQWSINYVN